MKLMNPLSEKILKQNIKISAKSIKHAKVKHVETANVDILNAPLNAPDAPIDYSEPRQPEATREPEKSKPEATERPIEEKVVEDDDDHGFPIWWWGLGAAAIGGIILLAASGGDDDDDTATAVVDTTITKPSIALTNDNGSSKTDTVTNDGSLTFSTPDEQVTRTYSINGGASTAGYVAPTADGEYTVLVTDVDASGNSATSTVTFTIDKTIATPTAVLAKDTGSSPTDTITNNAGLTFSAPASDVTRTYSVNGGAATTAYTAPTADGKYTVVVTDTDKAGNVATASTTFTLDQTIVVPTVALTNDNGSSNTDKVTNDASLTFNAPASDVTRTYSVNGGAATTAYTAPSTDGSYTVVVTDTDAAGNSATASTTFTLDKTLVAPTVVLTKDTGSSATDTVTSDASLTFNAPASDVTRTYSVNGAAPSTTYTAPTTDGSYTVVVTDTDKAGNSATASTTFTLDKTVVAPTIALTNDTGVDTADKITKDASLTFNAPASDVTRTYSVNGAAPSASYVAPTTDGSYTVVVTDTDIAGNTATASTTFTLDQTIATPVIALSVDSGSSATDFVTNDGTLTVSGAASDVTRTYVIDGVATSTFSAPGTDGVHKIEVLDVDKAGNSSSAVLNYTLDRTLDTPTIALTNDTGVDTADKITKDASLTFNAPASDVTRTYSVNGAAPSASYVAPTTDGSYTVAVTDTDKAGNTATASTTFTLDQTIAAPVIALSVDSGSSATDFVTNDGTLTVSGAASDVTRTYVIDGVATSTFSAPGTDGVHKIEVLDVDKAGNSSSAVLNYTLDRTLDTPTIALTNDTGVDTADKITKDASLTFNAPASDVTRTYSVNGAAPSASYVAPTTDGSYTVVVTDTDIAGNTATASTTFTLDQTIATPVIALSVDSGSSATDFVTNDGTLTVSGAASDVTRTYVIDGVATSTFSAPGTDGVHKIEVLDVDKAGNSSSAVLNYTLDRKIVSPMMVMINDTGIDSADAITKDASFAFDPPASDVTRTYSVNGGAPSAAYTAPTVDGEYTILLTDTDTAGNVVTASTTFTLDKTLAAPTVALTNDTGADATDTNTTDASLTFNTPASDVTRTYSINGAAPSTTYIAPTTDGSYTVVVTDTDVAGNSAVASTMFTLDAAAPAAPTVVLTNDTGIDAADTITKDASLTFNASASDVTRTYTINGGTPTSTYTAPIIDGLYTVVVTDTDAAGNSATASTAFTLDTTIPKATPALVTDSGASATDFLTNIATVTANGRASDVIRTFIVDGVVVSPLVAPGADGAHTIEVVDVDKAGNSSIGVLNYILDRSIDTPTVALTNDTGSSATDAITKDGALNVSPAAADVTRTYTINGGTPTAAYTVPAVDGAYTVLVTDTDLAGNSATATTSFTLDTAGPNTFIKLIADTGISSTDNITNKGAYTANALEAGATQTIMINGIQQTNGYYQPSIDGTHKIETTEVDVAGNSTVAVLEYVLDTKVNAGSLVHAVSGNDLSGSIILIGGGSVPMDVFGEEVGAIAVYQESRDQSNWVTMSNNLAQHTIGAGTYYYHALVTDVAGNTGFTPEITINFA